MISLIMLVVLTLLAVSSIRMSTVTLRTVNATQGRGEAMSAATRALDQILSSNFTNDIGSVAATYSVAIDATKTYPVDVTRPCLKQVQPIFNSQLRLTDAEDLRCYDSSTNPWSACANTVWQLSASVRDSFLGTRVDVVQGVAVRMDNAAATAYQTSTTPSNICP
jgi:Tfp pilus assembly protein PilX